MNFTHYWVIDSNFKTKYDNVIDYEEFDESSDEDPDGFVPQTIGTNLDEPYDDRSKVMGWCPTDNFFAII